MKTKIIIILWIILPFFGFSQIKPEEEKWIPTYMFTNYYQVSILNNETYQSLYYLMDNYIKISPIIKNRKPYQVDFENGEVTKISDSIFCIVPNKISIKENDRYKITINGKQDYFYVNKILPEKLEVKFSASTSPFSDCITLDELNKSDKIEVSYSYKKFHINHFSLEFEGKKPYSYYGGGNDGETIVKELRKKINENIMVNSKIKIDNVKISLYDSTIWLPSKDIKVIDSYENEFIRRTIKLSPFTTDLNLMKNDLRIKITGHPLKEDVETIKDLVKELNDLLETIKVKIVDNQPSLTIFFDSINPSLYKRFDFKPNDTLLATREYRRIIINYLKEITKNNKYLPFNNRLIQNIENNFYSDKYKHKKEVDYPDYDSLRTNEGYRRLTVGYLKELPDKFFPFNKTYLMYFTPGFSERTKSGINTNWAKYYIKKNILGLLANFNVSEINNSIFNDVNIYGIYNYQLSYFDKYLLKTLYSKGGEEKVKAIISKDFQEQEKKPASILLFVLSICLLFVFSEIYNYYNISHFISKVKYKIIKRIIESVLFAQVPMLAYLIIQLSNNGSFGLFRGVAELDVKLSILAVLSGILLLFLDKLLEKIKILWLSISLNLVLSFLSVAFAYQLMYFFKTPEIIKLSVVGWQLLLIPLLVTLYRLYAGFQTKKISGLLQEKELELSKQKELKFKSDLNALQARINPHFLYNTLNSLASLTHIDSDRTEKMALSLSKLFRYNINKNDEHYATLKDEIEMAEIYLAVEKNRFEDKLNYTIEIEEALKEFIIPKFILQPLAENAVKHGISKITGKGMIRINIKEEAQKVVIEIYDNGPDFPGGLISGYGLQNTYEKLKLLYKKPFDISFINKPEKKLVISLNK